MAERKFSPFPVLKQPKQPVYSALCELNQAFNSLAAEIESLQDSEAIPLKTLRFYRTMAEELRATINHRVTGVLHTREAKDAFQYEQLRRKHEKQYQR